MHFVSFFKNQAFFFFYNKRDALYVELHFSTIEHSNLIVFI